MNASHRRESRLDTLYNNGGIIRPPISDLTPAGLDIQFATNALSHFYLTQLLLPVLLSTVKQTNDGSVRVVNVAGGGHLISKPLCKGGPVNVKTLVDGPERNKLDITELFCQSKSVSKIIILFNLYSQWLTFENF